MIAAGRTVTFGAFDPELGAVGGGSHNPRGDVTEVVGVAVLPGASTAWASPDTSPGHWPRTRRRPACAPSFMSAGSDDVARVYEGVGLPAGRDRLHRRAERSEPQRTPDRMGGMDRGPSALSPEARIRALGSLSAGAAPTSSTCSSSAAGSSGAGVALDAVTRGLCTGLLEQRDLASGTSSRSSKLIHGGLRYLEMLDFGLVREALQERGLLLTRLAPHLVRPVPFLYPLTHRGWERPYVGAGLLLYDAMATVRASPRSGCRGTGT